MTSLRRSLSPHRRELDVARVVHLHPLAQLRELLEVALASGVEDVAEPSVNMEILTNS